jgi:cell growth-regulating nucleolar protein
MVWFQCEDCGDTLKKPKVKGHSGQCSASRFSCVDCMQVFDKWTVHNHTSCVTEHEKYALSITKPGQEHLMSAAAAGGGGGGGPVGGGGSVVGAEFLAKGPPWDCACCKVKCTSAETLMGHAGGKKHKSKSRTALAAMGKGLDGQPLPPPKDDGGKEEEATKVAEAEVEFAAVKKRSDDGDGDGSDSEKRAKKDKKKREKREKREKEREPAAGDAEPAKKAKREDKDGKEKRAKKEKK